MTYIITKSEAMHLHSTLEDAMMFYEMYTSKPSDTEDNEMEFRLKDCEQAQYIVKNLESDDMRMAHAIDQVVDTKIWTDTDYFD